MAPQRSILQGSARAMAPGARVVGKPGPAERVEALLVLSPAEPLSGQVNAVVAAHPAERKPLSASDYERRFGASQDALSGVRAFAREFGLTIDEEDLRRRIVRVSGTVEQMQHAFGVTLETHEAAGRTFRARTGTISLPTELMPHVQAVLGLDQRPQARPHSRIKPRVANVGHRPQDIAQLYGFPSGTGAGQTVSLIELGGNFGPADLATYFKDVGVTSPPIVSAVNVTNNPEPYGTDPGADGEVMLDIEVVGAIAPGAHIQVYFADNTDAGFYDAASRAVHDGKTNVVSISWGGPEETFTDQSRTAWDQLGQAAALLDVTLLAASGDDGASDERQNGDGQRHVDFPSSAPHVIGCGGTRLDAAGGTIGTEVVWNESALSEGSTGGGASTVFPVPSYQTGCQAEPGKALTTRGVPDVAGNADPETGYVTRADGANGMTGGTSAVAPLWAAFSAILNQNLGKPIGFFTPFAYTAKSLRPLFHDITSGDNSYNGVTGFSAHAGWDACTGLGSPDGAQWLTALKGSAGATTAV